MAAPDPSPTGSADRVLLDRYRLVRPLASGGMAEVWEAQDEVLARAVAVKLLHPHLCDDDAWRERFRREAVHAARLSHPNVVALYDSGDDDGRPFLVMELVRGTTLAALLAERGALPPSEAVGIAVQIAAALSHAHAAGVVHRDVKPGNVLVCEPAPPSAGMAPAPVEVKVTDFGIARTGDRGGDLTTTGTLLGTARYLAPEVVQGRSADARADVYALGVVLYEMLTGRPPFSEGTQLATAMAHVDREAPRPRQVRPGIPRSVEAACLRAMAKDPAQRCASADELRNLLLDAGLGADDAVPVVERAPTPPTGVPVVPQPAVRRGWLAPAGLAVAAVVLLLVVGLSLRGSGDGGGGLLPDQRADAATAGGTGPLPVAAVRTFDPEPQGDGAENEAQVAAVLDDDPTTTWATDRYRGPGFAGLKDGVGLVLDLGDTRRVQRVVVQSPVRGWSGRVYVAAQAAPTLAGWGEARAGGTDVPGDAAFELAAPAEARFVLLWFTDPGPDHKLQVGTVRVEAP